MRKVSDSKSAFLVIMVVVAGLLFSTGAPLGDAATKQRGNAASSRNSQVPEQKDLPPQGLQISPSSYDFSKNPALLERIVEGPHGYFRFINQMFAEAVCTRLEDDVKLLSIVNLHNDAHLEQYAITDRGRGITDFDAATTGPAFLDLVRFGVSIHLACRANGWEEQAAEMVDTFLSGYRTGLKDPDLTIPPPELVTRIRSHFTKDRTRTLVAAEKLMEPLEISPQEFEEIKKQYGEQMAAQFPKLPQHFFMIKKAGQFKLGIGSALDEKYLLRVEGSTKSPEDDLILEIKEVRALRGISCIQQKEADPARIMLGQARISYKPYRYVGYAEFLRRKGYSRGKMFWIHAWDDNYQELSIRKSFQSPEDMKAIAYDVGFQLGRGHPKYIYEPYDSEARRKLLIILDEFREDLGRMMLDLTEQTITAWRKFRAEVMKQKSHNRE